MISARGRCLRLAAASAVFIAGSGIAGAQTPVGDLYIQAAAVAEKCGTPTLDQREIAKLADIISTETKVPTTAATVSRQLDKARAAVSGAIDCNGPLTSIHVEFFKNVVLPRMGGQAPAQGTELSSSPP